ncbi:hypothetical protein ACFQZ8_14675 [Micromonospora azadirachtae]|uniref:Uncharacterized protein n=1 Tax=Micromonospora azadirachtae TaxID=1970735 RepID=A0ABW3A2J0_9ACTN
MGVSQRFKSRFRRFLQRPGTTVDLAPLEKLLPAIEAREEGLRALDDAELTEAARQAMATAIRPRVSAGDAAQAAQRYRPGGSANPNRAPGTTATKSATRLVKCGAPPPLKQAPRKSPVSIGETFG